MSKYALYYVCIRKVGVGNQVTGFVVATLILVYDPHTKQKCCLARFLFSAQNLPNSHSTFWQLYEEHKAYKDKATFLSARVHHSEVAELVDLQYMVAEM